MPLQNKNRIAYLTALTLLFSYAEMMLPRIFPFFRLGLGNIVILLALNLNCSSFLILTLIKSVASCLMAGTLFSPFFIISLAQSVISGYSMFLLHRFSKTGRWISVYGISVFGSAISAAVQICLSSIYIGQGTFALFGPMLIFSIFSGLITAFLSQFFQIPDKAPKITISNKDKNDKTEKIELENSKSKLASISYININSFLLLISVVLCSVFTMMNSRIDLLCCCTILGLIFQILCGRKIKFLPHIFMWLFIFVANIFVPYGKILFEFGVFTITKGAITTALEKSLKLSALMSLSQCFTGISLNDNSIFTLIFAYFNGLLEIFKNTKGNLLLKTKAALQAKEIPESESYRSKKMINSAVPVIFTVLYTIILLINSGILFPV